MRQQPAEDFERYVAGEMTPEEAADFLEVIQDSSESMEYLGEVLEQEVLLFDLLRSPVRLAQKGIKQEISHEKQIQRVHSKKRSWMPIAAAAMIAISVGLVIHFAGQKDSGEKPSSTKETQLPCHVFTGEGLPVTQFNRPAAFFLQVFQALFKGIPSF